MLNLEKSKEEQELQREQALDYMKANLELFGANLKEHFSVEGVSSKAKEKIQENPWIAVGAALGVGFFATHMMRPSPPVLPPQRVVVELKNPDGSVVTNAKPAAAPVGILRTLVASAASAAFVAVKPMVEKLMHEFVAPGTAEAPKPTAASVAATEAKAKRTVDPLIKEVRL